MPPEFKASASREDEHDGVQNLHKTSPTTAAATIGHESIVAKKYKVLQLPLDAVNTEPPEPEIDPALQSKTC